MNHPIIQSPKFLPLPKIRTSMKIRILILMVAAAAMARLLPHPFNFTPIGAMGLFGAAFFDKKWMGLAVPFAALFLTDLFVNNVLYSAFYGGKFVLFTQAAWTIYAGFAAYFLIGKLAFSSNITAKNMVVAALSGSVVFFLLTNFGSWLTDPFYPKTMGGLLHCYAEAIPFYRGSLYATLIFSVILFGGYNLVNRYFNQKPALIKL